MPVSSHPPAIFLMGPTASGKTALAVGLVERFPLEIVSVDSALVYRDMDIGTAKPDAATLAHVPHHLLDIRDPTETYSAAAFCDDARRLMADIAARGRVPLLVGGAKLYFRALLQGLDDLPRADAALRKELEAGPAGAARRAGGGRSGDRCTAGPERFAAHRPRAGDFPAQRHPDVGAARPCAIRTAVSRLATGPDPVRTRGAAPAHRRALRRHARRRPDRRSGHPAPPLRAQRRSAVHARSRLPPGLGLSRRRHRSERLARAGHRRHPPARQAPVDLVALVA